MEVKIQSTHANTLLRLKADKCMFNKAEVVDLVSPEKKIPKAKKQKNKVKVNVKVEEEQEKIECEECYKRHVKDVKIMKEEAKIKKCENYRQILIKNPDYTDKRRLGRDQSTLDPFILNFKQSKYLKSTILVSQRYKQLTINDFPLPSKNNRYP